MAQAVAQGLKQRLAYVAAGAAGAALVLVLGGCAFTTPPLADAEPEVPEQTVSDEELVQPGTLTVALDTADAPQVITGADGELQGYEIDVAYAIAESMGLDVAFTESTSPTDALESGEADIYLGATSQAGSDGIVVSGELFQNATAIFGMSEDASVTVSADDLTSARVGVQEGSASQEALAQMGVAASSAYDNVNECFEALAEDEVDYVACDATAGGYLGRSYDGVFFAGIISSTTSYGIAYSASSDALSDEVTAAFENIATDGTLDAIHQIWYGSVPLSLTDEVVAGVTIIEEDGDDVSSADESGASDTSGSSSDAAISGDMNSID